VRVIPIAETKLIELTELGNPNIGDWMELDLGKSSDAELLTEFAGRSCYESWNKPNAATRTNADYNKHIIEVGHFSVLEHASITFYIRDVSRSLTHELVRHRHFAYSQRSQRYADESANMIVLPPDVKKSNRAQHILNALDARAKAAYQELAEIMRLELGLSRKRARSAARAALLGSQSTAIVVTGNHRAWREFMSKRNDPAADEEIHDLAVAILQVLKERYPSLYADMGNGGTPEGH